MDTAEVVELGCSFRSYERVSKVEEKEFRRVTHRRVAIIVVSLVLLLGIAVAVTVMLVANRKGIRNHSLPPQARRGGPNPIALVCSVTSHPKTCYKSIEAAMGKVRVKDPKEIFKLSLDVANKELSRVLSLSHMPFIRANSTRVRGATQICIELIKQSTGLLNESATTLVDFELGTGNLTQPSINDVITWLSAVLTNLETCLDGFDGTNNVYKATITNILGKAREFISNSLAIAVKVLMNLHELGIPLNRKLLTVIEFESNPTRLLREASWWVPDAIVAKDGSGQFSTISEAVAVAPSKSSKPFVIYVKVGRYVERVSVGMDKWNIVMLGDGADKTVITGNGSFADGTPTFDTATFAIEGRGFMARDMGFENTADPRNGPAVAVRSNSDRSIFYRCTFNGHENTLYALSLRQFYRDCEIHGTVDFVFGNAAVVLQNCTLRPRQHRRGKTNTILAQGRTDRYQNTATSIQDCTISPFGKVEARAFLGRPWKPYSTAVVMKSEIGSVVDGRGWWAHRGEPPPTVFFGEYENFGVGSGVVDRVKWAGYRPRLSEKEAQRFLLGPLIEGEEWIPQRRVAYSEGL